MNHSIPAPDPAPDEKSAAPGETPPPGPLAFRAEADLEAYLADHLSIPGLDLLVIGRQIIRGIDLLAIDSAGVIYIIELKLNEARPGAVGQVVGYRYLTKQLNREAIIRDVAEGLLKVDLVEAFQRHFGHPLPETVNESQELMIIAGSIHPITAYSILEVQDAGRTITTFRYVVHSDTVSFIPCCRDARDVEEGSHTKPKPPRPSRRSVEVPDRSRATIRVPVDETVRRFWLTHAPHFPHLVTFDFISERYINWVHTHSAEGIHLHQWGQFARQLRAIIRKSNEWICVFVPAGTTMDTREPSVRTYRAAGYSLVAYQRRPVDPASES